MLRGWVFVFFNIETNQTITRIVQKLACGDPSGLPGGHWHIHLLPQKPRGLEGERGAPHTDF